MHERPDLQPRQSSEPRTVEEWHAYCATPRFKQRVRDAAALLAADDIDGLVELMSKWREEDD